MPARIDQRIQRVPEFLLDGSALDELHVVDDQKIDSTQLLLEGERGLRLQRRDEAVHEPVRRQIDDPLALSARTLTDGVEQMRLAQTDAGVNVERVVERRAVMARDAVAGGMS